MPESACAPEEKPKALVSLCMIAVGMGGREEPRQTARLGGLDRALNQGLLLIFAGKNMLKLTEIIWLKRHARSFSSTL